MINMDIPSAVLKERAKATLRGTYWTFVGATLIVAIVSGLISGIAQLLGPAVGAVASIAVALFYTIPVSLGVQRMYIRTAQGCGVNTNEIFNIYKSGNLMNAILALFLKGLFTFLWSLLFVVPGIIKGYSYLLIDYMMAENPALDQSRAFEISKQLMYGNRFKAFVVELSFIGWQLLSVLTFPYAIHEHDDDAFLFGAEGARHPCRHHPSGRQPLRRSGQQLFPERSRIQLNHRI